MFFPFFGRQKKSKQKVRYESVDTCINRQCPGLVDIIAEDYQLELYMCAVCRKTRHTFVCCSKCGHIASIEAFQRAKRRSGLHDYSLNERIHSNKLQT